MKLPRVVVALGFVSLLTDIASEMVYPLLPALMAALGAGAMSLGAIEGVGDATASVLKLVTGRLADRPSRRKPLVLLGYGLSSLVRPLFAFALLPWHVVGARFLDRVGKGLRSSPRDAILAASVPRASAGAAFGFHRAMDNVGATIGPLVASLVLFLTLGDVHQTLLASTVPGLVAVVVLFLFVPSSAHEGTADGAAPSSDAPVHSRAPAALRAYLLILGWFSIVNTSDLFLLRRLAELGARPALIPVLWAVLNAVRALSGYPGGVLADRIGRSRSMMIGWLVYAASYGAMALAPTLGAMLVGFVAYGFFYGLTEGAERAIVASLAPREVMGSAFGKFHLVTGLALLPSNVAFGWAWDRWGARPCLLVSAAGALVALVALSAWTKRYVRPLA